MPVYFVYFLFTSVYKEIFEPILSLFLKSLTGCPDPKSLKKTTNHPKGLCLGVRVYNQGAKF
jgi:hypothetical protein